MRKLLLCLALISVCACAACQSEEATPPAASPSAAQTETAGTPAQEDPAASTAPEVSAEAEKPAEGTADEPAPVETTYDVEAFLRGENKDLIEELQNGQE